MDEYFIGIVKKYQFDTKTIIFEYNNHGYRFKGINLHLLPLNQRIKLYVFFYQRLPTSEYFAFLDKKTKQYFLELISINYIGPNIALKILNYFNLEEFNDIIGTSDIETIRKVKGINNSLALAIIEHFKYKNTLYAKNSRFQDKWMIVFNKLIQLGFNKKVINKYLSSIKVSDWNNNLEIIIDAAKQEIGSEYY